MTIAEESDMTILPQRLPVRRPLPRFIDDARALRNRLRFDRAVHRFLAGR